MKRVFSLLAIMGLLVLCMPGSAVAQRGRGVDSSLLGLTLNKAVAKEAGLLDEQMESLADLQKALIKKYPRPQFDPQGDRTKQLAKFTKWRGDVANAAIPQITKILFPPQLKRVQEIQVQVLGPGALSDARVAKALKITKEQNQKITKLQAGARQNFFAIFQKAQGDRAKMTKLFAEANAKLMKDMSAVLTKDQTKAFAKLKGKPFKFPARSRRGRRKQ